MLKGQVAVVIKKVLNTGTRVGKKNQKGENCVFAVLRLFDSRHICLVVLPDEQSRHSQSTLLLSYQPPGSASPVVWARGSSGTNATAFQVTKT